MIRLFWFLLLFYNAQVVILYGFCFYWVILVISTTFGAAEWRLALRKDLEEFLR